MSEDRSTRENLTARPWHEMSVAEVCTHLGSATERSITPDEAYGLYNSSALLTFYFIQQHGGAPLAGYLDALRRSDDADAAERTHLLPGKTREQLTPELHALAKKLGVQLKP